MSSIYPPWANSLFWLFSAALVGGIVAIPLGLMIYVRTPYVTNQRNAAEQPIQFDHRHHVLDDGIDCLYCHYLADRSEFAGVPSTEVCLGCHGQIWHEAPILQTLRESYFYDVPIPWERVNAVPDFVFFSHRIHVQRGIGCPSCHGGVDTMPAVFPVATLSMQWCLDCHVAPERHLRPLDRITDTSWNPTPAEQLRIGTELEEHLGISPPVHCTACHR
ncbi:MAG TPA: cytochrome c3 family protein [Fredinandcohnia sp.]|nr:cytochrome c3 family protein [Fredinandcohnia sp.]